MGNKLSCSCAPLMRKAYRYEDSPWQTSRRRDGHLLRLWAEVFHVSASGAGTVKWQQVSEDLVPVNITCIQDSPECVFHITAYNSQVDKILDVRLVQPGTRIGQASECFVYWKDPMTNDTWGLNFTSPIDAKQFRECCCDVLQSPSFKFSRKASSSYSLKLDPPGKGKIKTKRKPLSTPASPSRAAREPQCTCMTAEQYARIRSQDPRYRGSSTLPRATTRATETELGRDKVAAATSSTSLYDNVASGTQSGQTTAQDTLIRQTKSQETNTMSSSNNAATLTNSNSNQNHVGSQIGQDEVPSMKVGGIGMGGEETCKSEGTQAGGTLQLQQQQQQQQQQQHQQNNMASTKSTSTGTGTRTKDYNDEMTRESHEMHHNIINNNTRRKTKSTEEMNVDTSTLKRMLKPMPSTESPVTSPEMGKRRYNNFYNANTMNAQLQQQQHMHPAHHAVHMMNNNTLSGRIPSQSSRFSGSRSSHEIGRGYSQRGLYLELERERGGMGCMEGSPPSDNVMFDNQCYATTPSSSNGNSDQDQPYGQRNAGGGGRHSHHHQNQPNVTPTPGSPTSRLLLEYEMHLRNTLAKGMDAESYSLHTFEALLSQSMENLGSSSAAKSSTLPLPHPRPPISNRDRERDRERDGYYSDRNELIRERERERERDRGYLSDHNSSFATSRCATCIGESARAQWFRHSDGWRSGSSTLGSGSGQGILTSQASSGGGHKRSPWDSLPSLRQDSSLNDSGYKSTRADSFEQRGVFDRQDSLRSDYLSDRESRYGIVQQASIDSTDSRLCYLTSSEISDDDRMSLTTAVSDEEDGESVMASPYKAKATGTAAASFNCTGAVRKAGFLSVKKWLLRKKHQIELARKRGWKGYWVCLKGTTLLFYPCDSREGRSVEAAPKHLIIVDGAIMQPIPEHPKRDYIFCLSTAFGDAYLFQAPCQVELENWVNSIHSACAAAFARHRGKTGTLHLLQEEIFRLEKAIESDHKLKHMAELQQSVVTDQDTRHQIQTQILTWEENLERLHCEQFRLRCYMASLQSGELPNPKSLLTHVSRPTKNTLNKLGVFTVSSFHAFICARSPSLLNNLLAGRGATKRRPPLLSRSNSGSSRRSMQMNSRDDPEKTYKVALPDNNAATVYLRDAMSVEEFLASACARKNLNPMEHFVRVKKRRDMEDHNYFVPHRNDLIETYLHTHEMVEVCAKILYQVELSRSTLDQMWGFSVEAELIENADRQDELCCYVSRVEDKSVAMQNGCPGGPKNAGTNPDFQGIIKGDEIMVINGAIVSDLDMMYLESVLQEEQALCMMMRSSRTEPPDLVGIMRVTDDMIDSLVCPPPPSDPPVMSEEMISGLIVPAPGWKDIIYSPDAESSPAPSSTEPQNMMSSANMQHSQHQQQQQQQHHRQQHQQEQQQHQMGNDPTDGNSKQQSSRGNSFEIENLLKTAEQVTGFCRSPQETRKSSPTASISSSVSNTMLTPSRQLSDAEKLRKVILELIDTERTYVSHLNNLLVCYLEPLKRETFLSNAEIQALFGNIQEIVAFQRQFLRNINEALEITPAFYRYEHCSQFKTVLFAIGSAFLYYVNHFKLYSSFCASHSKAQKVLHPNEGNQALQEFLAAKNPKQQHSSTLESYLIKPIQRILKYPLILQQMKNLIDPRSEEYGHIMDALKGMEKVAEHINEMQRIHEEYGAIFDHLFRQHQKACKQPIDLSPGMPCDLLYYGGVEWLNISDFLGKIKKGLELHAMCFVFKSAVVFLCKERLRQKKKLMGVSSKNTPNEVEIIRYQVLIPVTEVQVRASSAKDMDSHFLWELIHLRSQLQRRSEKVYVLSNSTADFRNAFLKTIRQIIRESVRNMSIPMRGLGSMSSITDLPPRTPTGNSQTLERPKQQTVIMQGSQTLGKTKKSKTAQRHSAGNIDYDNLPGSQEADDIPIQAQPGFRFRSKTVGDSADPPLKRHGDKEGDPGTKSEGEDDSQHGGTITCKKSLGKTPNHLTLSTTSTLSVGSTGSQARLIQSSHPPAHYQPVLMKDLGKHQSPMQDKNIVELFSGTNQTTTTSTGGASNTSDSGGGSCSSSSSSSSGSGNEGGGRDDDDDNNYDGGGDDEQKLTDSVMDRHLCALEDDSLNFSNKSNTCDIVKYMANLKKKHMESEKLDVGLGEADMRHESSEQRQEQQSNDIGSNVVTSKVDKVKVTKQSKSDSKPATMNTQTQTISKKEQKTNKHTLRSPNNTLSTRSPDRSRSTGTSPVRIIKIKSPRNSVSGECSGKRLSVSRDSSKDSSPDRRDISPRRLSEGGILKRSCSPKPEIIIPSSSSCSSSSSTGILKRSQSPLYKSKSPDRSCFPKTFSPPPDRNRLSSRSSIESRSPDRHRLYIDESSCYSPRSSFDSRASEPNLDIPRSVLKSSSRDGSCESRSPDRVGRKRSMSAHTTLDKKSNEPYYHHYYQFYQEQQQQQQQQRSPDDHKPRTSKSLERTSSRDSTNSTSSYRYGLSPERIYRIGPQQQVVRSQSVENAYNIKYGYDVPRSNESLSKTIENPTCVECLYQRKPS